MKFISTCFAVFCIILNISNDSVIKASNILALFPHPGYSHFHMFYPILRGLIERGHNVTSVSYFKIPLEPATANETHGNLKELILEGEIGLNAIDLNFTPSRSLYAMYEEFWALADEGHEACVTFYNSTEIVSQILEEHQRHSFDLIIMEMFNTDCLLGLTKLLSVPVVGLSSCALMPWHYDRVNLPDYPSFIRTEFVGFDVEMNFIDRLQNFIITKGVKMLYRTFVESNDNKIIKKYLNIEVDVNEIAKETKLILLNQHYSMSGSQPLSPQVIQIGGAHINEKPAKSIPRDLMKFMDSAKNGIIFVSWGSLVKSSSLSREKIDAIVNALKRFPQKVIWKWENEEQLPVKSDHFYFSSWLPQKEILCHPNVKLFWSHGGLLGTSEAVFCGVTTIVTPFYGDQFLNGKELENRKVGKVLHYEEITESKLIQIIKDLTNLRYVENAKRISEAYRNRQNPPLETALWWIEYILRNPQGENLLSSHSVHMNWFIYYSIDSILSIFLGILFLFFIICKIFVIIYRLFCKKNKLKKHKSKIN